MRLDLVVGPNGAGKSTFVRLSVAPATPTSVFVNADEIAKREWPDDPSAHSYDAAKIASMTRSALIRRGDPFIAETVFSHVSKVEFIDEAHARGYTVVLHALLVPVDLSVARVAERVANGGHPVPENKIRERHQRLWSNVVAAIGRADFAIVYDSSRPDGPREVARFAGGVLIGAAHWPDWAAAELKAVTG